MLKGENSTMVNREYQLTQSLLKLENIDLFFDEKQILNNISFEVKDIVRPKETHIKQGQVVGLLGPSGIGKTQLFRIIAGLQQQTSGSVYINGEVIEKRQGLVGVVAQKYPLFRHRTIEENLMIAAKNKYTAKKEAQEKINELLEKFKLTDKLYFYPKDLSGGQQQRIAIIQQLLSSEHLILMDEPFSGLDLIMKEELCKLISEISTIDELNTLIVVTHELEPALMISDTLIMLGKKWGENKEFQGAEIKIIYDLIGIGLAWQPNIKELPLFYEIKKEIEAKFRQLL